MLWWLFPSTLQWARIIGVSVVAGVVSILFTGLYQTTVGEAVFYGAKRETEHSPTFRGSSGGLSIVLISPFIQCLATNILFAMFADSPHLDASTFSGAWAVGAYFHLLIWLLMHVPHLVIDYSLYRISSSTVSSFAVILFLQSIISGSISALWLVK
jgi:hypothetical protein